MSYITPYYNESEDKFYITERFNGQRIINTLKPIYEFYVEDDFGNFEATNGKHVKKITAKNRREFMSLKKQYTATGKRTYEMSFDISFKVLEKYYPDGACEALSGKYAGIAQQYLFYYERSLAEAEKSKK